jgi:hypothetical protein
MASQRQIEQHNNTQIASSFFAYNGPLFIGGWKDFSKLVSNVNGRPLEVPPIPFSDPKEEFGGNFGYGGDPLHPISG